MLTLTIGYLIRRPVAQTRQETYELSSGVLMAIDYAKRMLQPHRTATQSRLSIIIDQISSLALATDENKDRRRQALREERDRIDQKLALLDQGHIDIIDRDKAAEKTRDSQPRSRDSGRFCACAQRFRAHQSLMLTPSVLLPFQRTGSHQDTSPTGFPRRQAQVPSPGS